MEDVRYSSRALSNLHKLPYISPDYTCIYNISCISFEQMYLFLKKKKALLYAIFIYSCLFLQFTSVKPHVIKTLHFKK